MDLFDLLRLKITLGLSKGEIKLKTREFLLKRERDIPYLSLMLLIILTISNLLLYHSWQLNFSNPIINLLIIIFSLVKVRFTFDSEILSKIFLVTYLSSLIISLIEKNKFQIIV